MHRWSFDSLSVLLLLLLLFKTRGLTCAMDILHAIFTAILDWISSNRLTINPPKTDFLLIDTSQQTSELSDTKMISSQTPSANNHGFIFGSHLKCHYVHTPYGLSCWWMLNFIVIKKTYNLSSIGWCYMSSEKTEALSNCRIIVRLQWRI